MRTGHVGARPLNAPMPWWFFKNMSDDDLKSIFAYLRTVKPVHHRVDQLGDRLPVQAVQRQAWRRRSKWRPLKHQQSGGGTCSSGCRAASSAEPGRSCKCRTMGSRSTSWSNIWKLPGTTVTAVVLRRSSWKMRTLSPSSGRTTTGATRWIQPPANFDTVYEGKPEPLFAIETVRFVRPDVVVAFVHATLELKDGTTLSARPSLLLTKEGGKWRIAVLHNTAVSAGQP